MLIAYIPLFSALISVAQALLVVQSSPQCASLCGNTLDSTSGAEITCTDSAYASSAYGAAFKTCLACEMSSTYFDPVTRISDLQWAIYNLRYSLAWCLFGWENNTLGASTPCITSFSCGPLVNAFEFDSLSQNASSYSYCPLLDSTVASKCTSCLTEMNNEHYLANFVTVLEAACQQQPVPGATLSLEGSIFSSTSVNITKPSATSASSYTAGKGDLALNAKVGIAVGALVLLLTIAGFVIVCCGKRRRRRVLAEKARSSGYEWQKSHGVMRQSKQPEQAFFDSPASQQPFANACHDEASPASATVEKAYFSPYSSQYTSPVNAMEIPNNHQLWPQESKNSSHVTEDERSRPFQIWPGRNEVVISPDGPSDSQDWPRDNKRAFSPLGSQKQQVEETEMRGIRSHDATMNVAPIITNPGYGRPVMTDDEVKKNYPF